MPCGYMYKYDFLWPACEFSDCMCACMHMTKKVDVDMSDRNTICHTHIKKEADEKKKAKKKKKNIQHCQMCLVGIENEYSAICITSEQNEWLIFFVGLFFCRVIIAFLSHHQACLRLAQFVLDWFFVLCLLSLWLYSNSASNSCNKLASLISNGLSLLALPMHNTKMHSKTHCYLWEKKGSPFFVDMGKLTSFFPRALVYFSLYYLHAMLLEMMLLLIFLLLYYSAMRRRRMTIP